MNDLSLSARLAPTSFVAGDVLIDTAQRRVEIAGEPARLGARAFDVLAALLERRDRVVGKRELLELVWPRLVVEENNLQVQIVALRKLLGPQAIATIPGRGYRFTLPVQAQSSTAAQSGVPPASPRARGNLPAGSPLLGRDDELRALTALVRRQPVVTIVGAGGIGKTRLAVAVAAALDEGDFVDGRWWVELADITDGARVPEAIAAALGQTLPAERPALPALVAALAGQRCLLVLDNCEHLADAVATVVDRLRAGAPSVHVLITSQELLKCADEQAWRLGTLAVPAEARLDDALQYGAVALFVERAHAVAPRFALAEDNVAAVIDICRRLDGIPLAIELAAARVPLLGVQGLHARLDQMFNVLTGASRLALRRHQTLRAALEWSHGLLSAEERAVFRRLGVFAGGFPMALAQRVASDADIDEWQVLDVLGHLIDKSLVIAGDEVEPRYRLLEPTRAYALEQLAAAGESDALFRRHAEAVLALLEDDDHRRWVAPHAERLRLVAEIGNVRAAVDWALAAGERRLACRLFGVGWTVWANNSASGEALERMRRLLPVPADLPARDEAAFCVALTRVRLGSGRDEFLAAALRAVALYRDLGDQDRLADALIYFVGVAASRNEPTEIGDALDEAEALLGPAPPPRRVGSFAAAKGAWLLRQHRYAEALAVYEHQAAVYRNAGNAMGECLAAINRANVLLDAADYDGAVQAARFAADGLERLKAPYGRYPALGFLAQGLAMRGDDVDVRPIVREVFNRYRGTDAVGPEIMATALQYARAGDAPRAGLLAGWARGAVGRSKAYPCPIDVHMRTRLRELLPADIDDATLERWQQAGERLTEVQVIAVAFDDAELAPLLA